MMGDEGGLRVAGTFGVVKISFSVALQSHGELVEVLGHLVVIVEVADVIDFTIGIVIVQFGDLIAAADEDGVIYDFDAERLKQSGRDALPTVLAEGAAKSIDDPHIAASCCNCGTFSIGKKIEPADAHPAVPRAAIVPW